jgi:hypothetical protein
MKTSLLLGAALDWAVAKCEGKDHVVRAPHKYVFEPATNWAQAGPIIEREGIDVLTHVDHGWTAGCGNNMGRYGNGPTPLIAAMRCYVASKLGDEVDVPPELL